MEGEKEAELKEEEVGETDMRVGEKGRLMGKGNEV